MEASTTPENTRPPDVSRWSGRNKYLLKVTMSENC